jgi:4-amino-4-deoxychorismate lyase
VKIIVSRGEVGRGYSVPASVSPNRVVLSSPAPQYPIRFWHEGVKLHVCEIRMSHQPRLAGIKHLNRLENVLARMEWDDAGIPEGLLLDADGWVVEGTMSNIFIRVGRKLITPDLSTCGVAGLQRDRILKHAPSLGLTPEISRFTLPTLLQAEEIFVCNSVIGVWPVRQIGATSIAPGPIATQMQRILESEID